MFHSEQLQEKWAPLLDHEGTDKIEDPHRRAVTSVLLENQEKFLREQQSFESGTSMLTEQPTNSTGSTTAAAGLSSGAAAAGPMAGFDPVLISLIRRAMPNLVAYDIAGVQPMSGPTGLIFAMRSRYTSNEGTETFYNEVDSAFSGQNSGLGATDFVNAATGLGTTSQRGSNPAILNPTGDYPTGNIDTVYNVGEGMNTGTAEALGTGTATQFTQMAFSIEKVTVLSLIHI